jgi:PleD family two-component response regulator
MQLMKTILQDPILKMKDLAGKRICLAGFGPGEAAAIRNTLESAEAFCRVVALGGRDDVLPEFDVALVHVGDIEARAWLDDIRKTHAFTVLLMGELDILMTEMSLLPAESADFLVDQQWSAGELILRTIQLAHKADTFVVAKREHPVVLIVDDDNAIFALLNTVLKRDGIKCHAARDGDAAIEMATQLKPDLIILDVNIPNRNGFDVLKILKQSQKTAAIHVLLLTGREQEADVLRGFGLGAEDYVIKPFNPMELGARVHSLLGRARLIA